MLELASASARQSAKDIHSDMISAGTDQAGEWHMLEAGFCPDMSKWRALRRTRERKRPKRARKLRKNLATLAGCPWNTRRDKPGSTGRCPRDFLFFTIEKLFAGTLSGGLPKLHLMCLFCSLVMFCTFSWHQGDHKPKFLQNKAQTTSRHSCHENARSVTRQTTIATTRLSWISSHPFLGRETLSRCPSTVSRTVWKRKRVNFRRIFLVSPTEKERKHACVRVQIEYGFSCFQVRFGLVVSTVWIGSEYGFVILLDESASESHTQNSTHSPSPLDSNSSAGSQA